MDGELIESGVIEYVCGARDNQEELRIRKRYVS